MSRERERTEVGGGSNFGEEEEENIYDAPSLAGEGASILGLKISCEQAHTRLHLRSFFWGEGGLWANLKQGLACRS